jgi:hypothetical protein
VNVPRHAAAAAKLLQRGLSTPITAAGDRVRGLATIERAMMVRARRRRWLGISLLAAAALLLGVGLTYRGGSEPRALRVAIQAAPLGKGATLSDPDRAQRLEVPMEITAGQLLETPPGGGASLQLSTGTNLTLAGETQLRVQSQNTVERFALRRGELSARVSKLANGQRFIVQTPDAEVEVRGTRFTVTVLEGGDACSSATRTRLHVTEGVVEVRSAAGLARVTGGQSWPVGCGRQEPEQTRPTIVPGQPLPASSQHRSFPPPGAAAIPSDRSSALVQQNDLFAQGVALRRVGDVSAALRVYQRLMREYPASPLAENAAVERLRLLSPGQPAKAREEARAYLTRYPRGFAVDEAKRLAEQP